MRNEGSEQLIKTKDSEGGLETEPSFLTPRSELELQDSPFFLPIPEATSAFVRIPVTKMLCNSSVTLSTAELRCAAPGSKGLAPTVVIQPFAGSNPDIPIPIPTAQHFMFPCRYEKHVLILGEISSVKWKGGRERFIMEHNYLAVHWRAAWHGLSSQTALPPLIAVLIAGAVLAFISWAASHSARTQMIKWPSQLPPLPIKRLQGACEIKEG